MPLAPPVLEYMAGLTASLRPDWDVALKNANVDDFSVEDIESDVVGISTLTHQSSWAYEAAGKLRAKGIKVLLGGPHPSALPLEAQKFADAVITGEAENIFNEVLSDLENDSLRLLYEGKPSDLQNIPYPRRDVLSGYIFRSYFTARGCAYDCKFCTTPKLHGRKIRYRPIEQVISDISSSKNKRWFCSDPNIWGPDIDRYTELFKEMSRSLSSRTLWIGEGSLSSVQQPGGEEMLYWARHSGLRQVLVGLESFNSDSLADYRVKGKIGRDAKEAIRKIRHNGIDVILFLMLGHPDEDKSDYIRTLEECDKLDIAAHPVMVVPYPGTDLYEEYKEAIGEHENWDYFDGLHSVIPGNTGLTSGQHEQELINLWVELYKLPKVLKRLGKISYKGFPNAHISSMIVQIALRNAFNKYAKDYKS